MFYSSLPYLKLLNSQRQTLGLNSIESMYLSFYFETKEIINLIVLIGILYVVKISN